MTSIDSLAVCGDHELVPPDTIEQVTPTWLTRQLRAAGYEATVRSFTAQPVGAGMMALTYRLVPTYLEPTRGPDSLTIKLTAPGRISRKSARIGYGLPGRPGFYAQETIFYARFASTLAVRVPRPYFAWVSEEGDRFALLLEDISPAAPGDDLTGCSVHEAAAALRNLAALHAAMWDSPDFERGGFLQRFGPQDAAVYQRSIDATVTAFRERFAGSPFSRRLPIVEAFRAHAAAWFTATGRHTALTHNDFRLDNLLFTEPDGECVVLDWQTFMVSHPGRDIGLFLGASIPTALRRAHGDDLLHAYHDALHLHGVTDYPFTTCVDDFRYGAFLGLHQALVLAKAVDMTERGLAMFDAWFERACCTIEDLGAVALLP